MRLAPAASGAAALIAAVLALAPSAPTETLVAGPDATRQTKPCTVATPCKASYATGAATVGDDVQLLDGTYVAPPSAWTQFDGTLGPASGAHPVLDGVSIYFGGTSLHDLTMHRGTLDYDAALVERLVIDAPAGVPYTVRMDLHGTLRDSVVTNDGANGVAVDTQGPSDATTPNRIENVTAIATGADSIGFRARTSGLYPGDNVPDNATVVHNSILRGAKYDVVAATDRFFTDPGRLDLTIATSSFRTTSTDYLAGGAFVQGDGNQTAPAQTDAAAIFAAGDPLYRQRVGSPTIDAGAVNAATGTTDPDGDARVSDGRPDIGADEMLAAPVLSDVGATATGVDAAQFSGRATGVGQLSMSFDVGTSAAYGSGLPGVTDGNGLFGAGAGGFAAGALVHYRAVATATNGVQSRTTSGPDAVLQLPAPAVPAPPAIPVASVVKPPALKASAVIKLPAASTKTCSSRRTLTLRLAAPAGTKITKAVVKIASKTKTYKGKDVKPKIDLRGLPKGKFSVKVTITLADGRTATLSKTYKTCAPQKKSSAKKSHAK